MSPTIDPQHFRDVLGNYPTGVCVITALADDGQALAMVVGTFTSVSLDPPLVAFLPSKGSSSFAELREAERFAVNILAHDQEPVVRRLARSDRQKMDHERWSTSPEGTPVLEGVVAAIDCVRHAVMDAGDHYIVLGEVRALRTLRPTMPLLFFRGGYGEFAPRSFVVPEGRGLSGAVAAAQMLRADLETAAERMDGELTVFARISTDSVAVATAPAPQGDQLTPLGVRYPLVPPIGAQYLAWSDERDQQLWMDRAVGATADERDALRRHLADTRRWGWSVSVVDEDEQPWPHFDADGAADDEELRGRHATVTRRMAQSVRAVEVSDIDPEGEYRAINFMAPVFVVEDAVPELMVRLLVYPARRSSGAEVLRRGGELAAFAARAAAVLRDELFASASAG